MARTLVKKELHVRRPRGAIARAIARGAGIQEVATKFKDAAEKYSKKAVNAQDRYAKGLEGYLFGFNVDGVTWEGLYSVVGNAMDNFLSSESKKNIVRKLGELSKDGQAARVELAKAVYKAIENKTEEYRLKSYFMKKEFYKQLGGGVK